MLNSRTFSLKVKGMGLLELCKIGDVIWENEIAILRKTENAMVRAMCGAKLIEKRGQRT